MRNGLESQKSLGAQCSIRIDYTARLWDLVGPALKLREQGYIRSLF